MPSWTHPEIGEFTFSNSGWCATLLLPGFAAFNLDASPDFVGENVDVMFDADEPDEFPTVGMVQVAQSVISNHQRLLDDGLRLFYDDICGVGPDSGMWWYGGLEQVNEILSNHSKRLDGPDDIYSLLEEPSLQIQQSGYGYDAPCAIIGFESPIDVEHGIGWLSDGKRILGTGHSCDVSPNDSI
ncbi:MAG: hypothetical protein AAFN77_08570 [Planctomycetota bacterium]